MFKKVVTYKNFWKSVLYLALPFILILFLLNWGVHSFAMDYFEKPLRKVIALLVGGIIYGFTMAYVKFWSKLKEQEQRNR